MNIVKGQSTENTFDGLSFDILTSNEMKEVRGGSRPKTRDNDIFDMDDK